MDSSNPSSSGVEANQMDTSIKDDTNDKDESEAMEVETAQSQHESPVNSEKIDASNRESTDTMTTDDEGIQNRPFLDNLEENYSSDSANDSTDESDIVEIDSSYDDEDDEVMCLSGPPKQTLTVSRPQTSSVYNPIQLKQEGFLPIKGKAWVIFRSRPALGIQITDGTYFYVYDYVSTDLYECEKCKLKKKVSKLIFMNKQPAFEKENHHIGCYQDLKTLLIADHKKLMEKSPNEPVNMATVIIPSTTDSRYTTRGYIDKLIDCIRKAGSEIQDSIRYDVKSNDSKVRTGYTVPEGKEDPGKMIVYHRSPPPEPAESSSTDISSRLRRHAGKAPVHSPKKKSSSNVRRSVRQTSKSSSRKKNERYSPQPSRKVKRNDFLIPYSCPLTMANELPSSLYQIRKIDSETSELIEIMPFNDHLCRVYISDRETIGKHYQQYYCRHCSTNPPSAYHFKSAEIVLAPPSEKHQCGPLTLDNVLTEQHFSSHRKRTKSKNRGNSISKRKQDVVQDFNLPANCPFEKNTRIPKYDWYFRQIGGETSYEWLFAKIGDTEKAYDLLEDACDEGFYAYCCRDCRIDTVKAVYLKEQQEVLALPLIEHDCCYGLPKTVETVPSAIITKEDRQLLPIPDNLWILPCDENNVAKKSLYLVSENNFRKGREFIVEAKKVIDDVMYVCKYCITQNHTVYAMASYENGRIFIDAEKSHLPTCTTIHLADLLAEETKVLINPPEN